MNPPETDLSLEGLIDLLGSRAEAPHPCPYLPDRQANLSGFLADSLPSNIYLQLMDRGFRRSGRLIYRPACEGCRECVPLRIPVESFKPSRNQTRVQRRNRDLTAHVGPLTCTPEKWRLYVRYLRCQHDGTMSDSWDGFRSFLYEPIGETIEFEYRLGDRLAAVSIADRCPGALSSVYTFFDPTFGGRSLGTNSVLWEIDYCRAQGLEYYYLGYYVRDCQTMSYKARFRPHQLLCDYRYWAPHGA